MTDETVGIVGGGIVGLAIARELSRRAPDVRLLILSMYDNEQYLFEALKAGASGLAAAAGRRRMPLDRSAPAFPLAMQAVLGDQSLSTPSSCSSSSFIGRPPP